MLNILVTHYTESGNTEKIARAIYEEEDVQKAKAFAREVLARAAKKGSVRTNN